jgi:HK97 family phage prohead protease
MNLNGKEIRTFGDKQNVSIREEEGKPTTIEGYAVVFNSRSVLMYDWMAGEPFYETIDPAAITQEDLNSWDVRATLDHDFSQLLARCINGSGSLKLTRDDKGVKYEFPAPDTVDGKRACERIRRGELFGSSFMFSFDDKTGCNYSRDKDNNLCRCVTKIDRIYDVSIVQNPAYQASSVTQRSVEEIINPKPQIDEKAESDRLQREKDMSDFNN